MIRKIKIRFYRFLKIYSEFKLLYFFNKVDFVIDMRGAWKLSNEKKF